MPPGMGWFRPIHINPARYEARLVSLLGVLVILGFTPAFSFLNATEPPKAADAKAILAKQGFPWYDPANDRFVPVIPDIPPETDPKIINPLGGLPSLSVGKILLWFLLFALIALAIYALIRYGLPRSDYSQMRSETHDETITIDKLEALPDATRGKGDLLGRAMAFAKDGSFGDAITFFHSWQLLQLDRLAQIELQKGKTNRDYLGELSASPIELRRLFLKTNHLFEDVFFGGLTINEGDFLSVWEKRGLLNDDLIPVGRRK